MELKEADISRTLQTIWEAVLHYTPEPAPRAPLPSLTQDLLASIVYLNGTAWKGTIALICNRDMARQTAAQMFGVAVDQMPTSDVNDAMGELANMLGGNVRALLHGPCELSLPKIFSPCNFESMQNNMLMILPFRGPSFTFWVALAHGIHHPVG